MSDDIGDRIATLIAERDEARAWVRRLTADARVLTCAYCGTAYPPGTPASNATALNEHVRACTKHPLRQAEAVAKRLRDIAANAIDHVNDGDMRAELRAQLAATVASDAGAVGTEASP